MGATNRVQVLACLLLTGVLCANRGYAVEETTTSPRVSLSAEEIAALFQRPASTLQLLENLKLAVNRDLLLQPAFYEDSVLLKVFPGKSVARTHLSAKPDPEDVSIEIDDTRFPRMTVSIGEGTAPTGSNSEGGRRFATLHMSLAEVPGLNVCMVRDVFGQRAGFPLDTGTDVHGNPRIRELKGYVGYAFYGDETATPSAPYSKRYQVKEILFGVKLESDAVKMQPLWPAQMQRIRNRDGIENVAIRLEDK